MRTLRAILLAGLAFPLFGQGPAVSFEVASIHASTPGTRQRILIEPSGRFFAEGVSLKLLIASAWHLLPDQMSGGETWTTTELWTVQATAEGITVPSWAPPFLPEIIAARVRSLVIGRFALKIHHETRERAVYRLTIGKAGARLNVTRSPAQSDADDRTVRSEDVIPARGRGMAGPGVLVASAIPMQQFVTLLGRWMDRPIIDKTGLTGYVESNSGLHQRAPPVHLKCRLLPMVRRRRRLTIRRFSRRLTSSSALNWNRPERLLMFWLLIQRVSLSKIEIILRPR